MDAIRATMSRAKQTIDEKILGDEKTELDQDLQRAVNRMEDIKHCNQIIVANIEAHLQHDSCFFQEGKNKADVISEEANALGAKLGSNDPYGQTMVKAGEAFSKLGQAKREQMNGQTEQYLNVIKEFLNTEMKAVDVAKKDLEHKRLDMDAVKPKDEKQADEKYQKAHEQYEHQLAELREAVKVADKKLPELKAALKASVGIEMEFLSNCQHIWKDFSKHLG